MNKTVRAFLLMFIASVAGVALAWRLDAHLLAVICTAAALFALEEGLRRSW